MKQIHLCKWITLSILIVSVICSCSNDNGTEEIDDYATDTSIAVTGNASAITPVSAEIVCKANITQGAASFELGVLYSTNSEELADFNGNKVRTKDLVGNAYKVTLSSLQPNTTYYYRSFVTTGGINNFGKVKSFTTQSVSNPSTLQADTITAFSAYLHAKREITKDYVVYYLYATSTKIDDLINDINKEILSMKLDKQDFDRAKKVLVANEVKATDSIERMQNSIFDDIVRFKKIIPNRIDMIKKLNYNTLKEIVNKIDFGNKSIVKMIKKRD